jgi:mannose-1-phosphate guanylyltransferase/mannose-6-phosphate isomerase
MTAVIPVILSGGSGTRLWPKSRKAYPKQLHTLYGDCTLLQHTVKRVSGAYPPIVVCNESQRFMVAEQLDEICPEKASIILEPVGRNTAPAIAVAAYHALSIDPDAVIVVLAADHLIKDQEAFQSSLVKAVSRAEQGKLVAFGVVPTKPETGYGYINSTIDSDAGGPVNKFVEKPDAETAVKYLASGDYFWNSGMFVFRAQDYLDELTQFEPEIVTHSKQSLKGAVQDLDFIRLEQESFGTCKDISVDYAVMERTGKAWTVPLDAQWSDLGSWESLWDALDKDADGNVISGDVILEGCTNSLFHSEHRLVSAVGVQDLIVVDTDDSLLIVNKSQSQNVKAIVDKLKASSRSECNLHRKVYRPWGSFDDVDVGERYKVKRIEVKPGASLSLQMHHHRAEHWVVVSGTALVQKGKEEILVSENESIFIPLGEHHRLSNPGRIPLSLIEIQSGAYLSENDIVRFDDSYGREINAAE